MKIELPNTADELIDKWDTDSRICHWENDKQCPDTARYRLEMKCCALYTNVCDKHARAAVRLLMAVKNIDTDKPISIRCRNCGQKPAYYNVNPVEVNNNG